MKMSRVLLLALCAISAICLLTFVTSSLGTSAGNGKKEGIKIEVAVMPDQQQFTNPSVPVVAVRTVSGLSEPDANAKKQYLIKEVIVENRAMKNVSSVTIRWIIAPLNNRTTTLARGDFKPHVMQSLRKTLQVGKRQTLKLSHPRLNQLIDQVPNRPSLGEKYVFLIGVAEVIFEDGSSWKEELTQVSTKVRPQIKVNRISFSKSSFVGSSLPLPRPAPTPYCRKTICKIELDSNGNATGLLICSPDDDPTSMSQCEYVGGNCHGEFCEVPSGTTDTDQDGYDSSEDCNDNNFYINPGVNENCSDAMEVDEDCDGMANCLDDECFLDDACTNCKQHWEYCNGPDDICCDQMVCRGGQCVYPDECNPACSLEQVCFNGLCGYTPIIVDVAGNGFRLTDSAGGVNFDFDGNAIGERIPWTAIGSDDSWLVLDRNGNGTVDNGSELFGSSTPQPPPSPGKPKNGFSALAEYDKAANGGNQDGRISQQDAIFVSLRLWNDNNRNGISEPSELVGLDQRGVEALELDYRESARTDQYGNVFKYRAKVVDARGARLGRWAYDVFLKL